MNEQKIIERYGLPDEHCGSCHDDEDDGYADMIEIEIDGEGVALCCAVRNNLEKRLKERTNVVA